jgi:molecular chaperone DnaK (HSP70)
VKLGIDFGTTRIVAARADRGNYPVISFDGPDGQAADYIPALVAARGDELRYGWDAFAVAGEAGWTLTRSIKRLLDTAGPYTRVDLGPAQIPVIDVLTGLALAIRRSVGGDEPLEVMIGVPANSNSNQRYLTAECFRLAGFQVLGLLNEPSAAGVEYGHSIVAKAGGAPVEELLLIYDLGGGTFDASLVELKGNQHTVAASEGIATLGGDDFDSILAEIAIGEDVLDSLTQDDHFRLQEICRAAKEALHPNSRRITLDLEAVRPGLGLIAIPVTAYYDRCRPLVEETLNAIDDLLEQAQETMPDCLYITGGGSELPLVARMLREKYGRRVKRSAYTRAATAIGLAIHADGQAGFALRERFARYFGVWREADGGREIIFDPVFDKGTPLPGAGDKPLRRERDYSPAHNIGHFRYLESSAIDEGGRPAGDITLWDDILFPFDPDLEAAPDLSSVPVEMRHANGRRCTETWICDANGAVEVELRNHATGYLKRFRLGRWSTAQTALKPARTRRRQSKP